MMKMLEAIISYFDANRKRGAIAAFFIIAVVFGYLLTVSWHKWGDLIVDTSREIWVPLQIVQGKVLYKDIYYFHGPLPAYLIALLYKMFGVSINALIGCGIVISILMCLCMYKLSRLFMDTVASTVMVANFCFVFAFAVNTYDGIYNYILPYSVASTLCMLFISAALYYYLKFIEYGKSAHLATWGILLTLASLARPETALSVWIVFLISGLLVKGSGYKKRLFMLISPLVLSTAVYAIVLYKMQAFAGFRETLLGSVLFASKGKDLFVVDSVGLRDIGDSILQMIQSYIYHLTAVVALCFGSLFVARSFSGRERRPLYLISGLLIIVMAAVAACKYLEHPDDLLQYRCIPLVLLLSLSLAAVKMVCGKEYKNNHKLFTLSIVAMLLGAKILFNSTPVLYGFYLLNIGIVGYYLYFINITEVINRKYFPANAGRLQFLPILLVFISLFITSWNVSANIYADKNLKVDSGKGTVYCWNDEKTAAYWDAVNFLKRHTLPNESLVVLPEGASLNYYSGRTNPLQYFLFLPGDIEKIGEAAIMNQLFQNRIDYVAIIHRPSEEYGYKSFGVDYGVTLYSWIKTNYLPVEQFGAVPFASEQFGILLLKRQKSTAQMKNYAHPAP